MKPSDVIKTFPVVLFAVPVVLFINPHAVPVLLWSALLLFILLLAKSWWSDRKAEVGRKARVAAILASKPAYVALGSGAPPWLAAPIYMVFVGAALALLAWELRLGSEPLRGFGGFLTATMISCAIPFAMLAAAGVRKALAWHLRSRFPDKLLAFANDKGIGTSDGWVIPYTHIRRIDPCSHRSGYGTNDWIEIADEFGPQRVPVNMSLDPPDEILKQLRDRALAGGADLAPALPNGRLPSGGTQLGYRMGYLPGE
jgi:hypothetical protein